MGTAEKLNGEMLLELEAKGKNRNGGIGFSFWMRKVKCQSLISE